VVSLLGDVRPLGLESVLVGDVGDGVGDPIGTDVAELAPDGDALVFPAFVPDFSLLVGGQSVAGLVTERDIFSHCTCHDRLLT
jgi:hypothetical protein